jgi:hypothetical protein
MISQRLVLIYLGQVDKVVLPYLLFGVLGHLIRVGSQDLVFEELELHGLICEHLSKE